MAGSLNHIVDHDTGVFRMDGIENLGDAYEALDECFKIIYSLTGGSKKAIDAVCHDLGFPCIARDMALGGRDAI